MGFFDLFKKKTGSKLEYNQAQNCIRILNDCMNILQTTTNEDTFYYRLDLAEEKINQLCNLNAKTNGTTPQEVRAAFYRDREKIIDDFNKRRPYQNPYTDQYYRKSEQLESMWSVLQNLKIYEGPQAESFESLCKECITLFLNMTEADRSRGYSPPKHAACYVRLAMLYEKQGRYQEAINTCTDAIRSGAWDDHSKGKMYGRLARMIRKSGINVGDDIKKLAEMR